MPMLQHASVRISATIGLILIVSNSVLAGPVDLFEDGPFRLEVVGGGNNDSITQTGLNPSTVIGGRRDVTLANFGFTGPNIATAELVTTGGNDFLVADADSSSAVKLQLNYGAGGDLNADFSRFNAISIFFQNIPTDAVFEFDLTSGTGSGRAVLDPTTVGDQPGAAPNEARFNFNSPGFSDVDFGDIDTMQFTITTDFGGGFAIGEISAIPLPPALYPALGTMAAFLAARAWRKGSLKRQKRLIR